MKTVNRKVEVFSTPAVAIDGSNIRLSSHGFKANTRFNVHGDLSPFCAARLVKELRRALRTMRDEKVRYYNSMVAAAEEAL